MEGEGVQLTIDTQRDTYEQAITAVQAAYGLNPAAVASSWPNAPAHEPRPGPETLSSEDLWEGWTDRLLFDTVAAAMPGARAVLRRLIEIGDRREGLRTPSSSARCRRRRTHQLHEHASESVGEPHALNSPPT